MSTDYSSRQALSGAVACCAADLSFHKRPTMPLGPPLLSLPPVPPREKCLHAGDSDDTPPTPQPRRDPEEDIIVDMETRKEGKRKGKNNGRILFFDKRGQDRGGGVLRTEKGGGKTGLTVEQVVLRERNQEGGWAGLHCECSLIMFLMVLLLWEEVFDLRAMAAFPHCLAVRCCCCCCCCRCCWCSRISSSR